MFRAKVNYTDGRGREIRTPDPLVRSQVPYPLGHGDVVEGDGFEPPQQMSFGTPALTWRTPP